MAQSLPITSAPETYLWQESTDKFVKVDQDTLVKFQNGEIEGFINNTVVFTPDSENDCYSIDINIGNGKPWTMEALAVLFTELKIAQ